MVFILEKINCIFKNRYKIINEFFVENTSNILFKTFKLHQDNSVVWILFLKLSLNHKNGRKSIFRKDLRLNANG